MKCQQCRIYILVQDLKLDSPQTKQEEVDRRLQYLNTYKAECAFVVGKETAKVIKIDTDRLAADLVALELEHGPAIYEHNK